VGGKEREGLYSSLDAEREGGIQQAKLPNLAEWGRRRSRDDKMRRVALGASSIFDRRPRTAVFGILGRQQKSLFRLQ